MNAIQPDTEKDLKNMIRGVLLLACVLVAAFALDHPNKEKLSEAASGSISINPAAMAVDDCLSEAKCGFDFVRCYELAHHADSKNFSWTSRLALAYLRTDMRQRALQAMNNSATEWLKQKVEAGFFKNETLPDGRINITFLDAFRRVYDDADQREDNHTRSETIEIAMMAAKMFEIEHRVSEAHTIYYGFLNQLGVGADHTQDFHRRTGNVVAMMHAPGAENTGIAFRVSEAFLPIVDGMTEHIMSHPVAENEKDKDSGRLVNPFKRYCGIEINDVDEVKVREVIDNVARCIAGWGNFSQQLGEEEEDDSILPFGVLRYTPAHRLASLGQWPLLAEMLKHFEGKTISADRFGRGLLHYAAAYGQDDVIKGLMENGGRLDKEDKGKVQPTHLGCNSPTFKDAFERILGANDESNCEGITRPRFEDEDAEVTDDSGNDGDWNPGAKLPKYLQCDFDVRDAASMTATDLLLGYVHSNVPVVLRNAFYDTDGPHTDFRAKNFKKRYGDVRIREEVTQLSERYGGPESNNTSIKDFMNSMSKDDGLLGDVILDTEAHPLEALGKWAPRAFRNKKYENELQLFEVETPTLFSINKKGSSTWHRARAFPSMHATVYGYNDYVALPPRSATSRRGKLREEQAKSAMRCTLYTGDVLILPEMWSVDYTSRRNGIVLERTVHLPVKARRAQ